MLTFHAIESTFYGDLVPSSHPTGFDIWLGIVYPGTWLRFTEGLTLVAVKCAIMEGYDRSWQKC